MRRLLLTTVLLAAAAPLAAQAPAMKPTVAQARTFIANAEKELRDLGIKANQADWVANNFITDDTEALTAEASKNYAVAVQRLALAARKYESLPLPAELMRKLLLLKLGLSAPPPGNPAEAEELSRISAALSGEYGKGTYCPPADSPLGKTLTKGSGASAQSGRLQTGSDEASKTPCLQINALSKVLATSTDTAQLREAWEGWHRIGAPMKERYARFAELSNKGARELGYHDVGQLWRAKYDMSPDAFSADLERLWAQVRPLYLSLHAYVRAQLAKQYGTGLVKPGEPIPAHLLGNMWAQEWGNIYPLVAPATATGPGFDVTELIARKGMTQRDMVKTGENFFTSLGMQPLPASFWERSLITKPRDREVVCHASAWTVENERDVRLKMCTERTGEDFVTVHHELGHLFYDLAYADQPYLFQGGANDGFHEAIGDAIALSITPDYLKAIGLLEQTPSAAADTMLLLRQALDKVAFLPFGLLIDQWRWKVFSGEVKPAQYEQAWLDLREKYQGVKAPVARTADDFDPGAKYHVPANTPYTRYFLARILQFQFYKAMCDAAGYTGPLNRCTFFGNEAAGAKLSQMMALGQSKPWPDALQALTGTRQIDAGPMLEYFAPLKAWLDQQNKGVAVGW